jgi:hypothetical protein
MVDPANPVCKLRDLRDSIDNRGGRLWHGAPEIRSCQSCVAFPLPSAKVSPATPPDGIGQHEQVQTSDQEQN